jgi:hypothetical protein
VRSIGLNLKGQNKQKNQFFSFGINYLILYIKALAAFIPLSRAMIQAQTFLRLEP